MPPEMVSWLVREGYCISAPYSRIRRVSCAFPKRLCSAHLEHGFCRSPVLPCSPASRHSHSSRPSRLNRIGRQSKQSKSLDCSIALIGDPYELIVKAVNAVNGDVLGSTEAQGNYKSKIRDALNRSAS